MDYDLLATFYDSFIDPEVYDEYIKLINEYTSIGSVLDIGCGTGTLSIEMAKAGYNVVATDLSEEMLQIVSFRAKEEDVELEIAMYDMLDPIEFLFDTIIASMDVINHLTDLEDVEFGFTNIYNSLKQNGIFIFDVLSAEYIDALDGYKEKDEEYHFSWESHKGDKPHSILHTIKVEVDGSEEESTIYEVTHDFAEYERIFTKVGFTQLDKIILPERTIYVLHKDEMKPQSL
ncbi:MAG: class I SAM-dependent methyltransferase [Bacilli bacterium]|nr:class I SAM-dependent methyltransferase [Bacilli bacterium]MBN2876805.1 class I SAM-dependent methyltransferase [Bacilli bacterium]